MAHHNHKSINSPSQCSLVELSHGSFGALSRLKQQINKPDFVWQWKLLWWSLSGGFYPSKKGFQRNQLYLRHFLSNDQYLKICPSLRHRIWKIIWNWGISCPNPLFLYGRQMRSKTFSRPLDISDRTVIRTNVTSYIVQSTSSIKPITNCKVLYICGPFKSTPEWILAVYEAYTWTLVFNLVLQIFRPIFKNVLSKDTSLFGDFQFHPYKQKDSENI